VGSDDELVRFVREALAAGHTRVEITDHLRDAGWTDPQIHDSLRAFGQTLGGVPVPRPRPSSGARDAFVYGGMFVSLYMTAWALCAMLFGVVDLLFAEAVPSYLLRNIRWPLSVGIVSTPVFVLLHRLVTGETRDDPLRRTSDIRRKLTYVTLFISGLVVLTAAASLIYDVLGGDPALTFVLKSIIVGGVAALGFVHYLREMRDEPELESVEPQDEVPR